MRVVYLKLIYRAGQNLWHKRDQEYNAVQNKTKIKNIEFVLAKFVYEKIHLKINLVRVHPDRWLTLQILLQTLLLFLYRIWYQALFTIDIYPCYIYCSGLQMNAINVISDTNELIFFYQNYRRFSIFNYKKTWNLLTLNVLYVCTILLLSYTNFVNSIYQKIYHCLNCTWTL